MKNFKTKDITKMALLTSLLCVSAYICIPLGFTPTPVTAQTLVLYMTALILIPKKAFLCVLAYILIGFAGFPVFSGFTGGPAKLFGPTGGYISSFLIAAPLVSFVNKYFLRFFKNSGRVKRILISSLICFFIGMSVVYISGSVYMKFMINTTFLNSFVIGVLPYILFDFFKCVLAAVISDYIVK